MKKWLKIIGGLVATAVGIFLIVIFAPQVLELLQGVVGIIAAAVGIIFVVIGLSESKE